MENNKFIKSEIAIHTHTHSIQVLVTHQWMNKMVGQRWSLQGLARQPIKTVTSENEDVYVCVCVSL